ncbi:unnamed protein product [Lota lota]
MLTAVLLSVCVLTAGVHAQLSAGTLPVDYGRDAEIHWRLPTPGSVAQVTVHKKAKTGDATLAYMATYSKRFGQQINDPYRDRVEWSASSSSSTPAITIKNVTWSDEACYICTFQVYTTGSQSQTTCLSVRGISNVRMDLQQTQPGELVVSCSATGKPAPNVRWDAAGIDNSTETIDLLVENADTTFSVSRNLTLLLPTSANSVDCVIDGGSTGPWREQISLLFLYGQEDQEVEKESRSFAGMIAGIIVFLAICIAIVALKVQRKKKMQQRKALFMLS